jgi:hypothetical protein
MKMVIRHIVFILIAFGCSMPENVQKRQIYPPIYPEYTDVTIPVNIAPLNFLMRDSTNRMVVTIKGGNDSVVVKGHNKINIPLNKWKSLLRNGQGKSLSVEVLARLNGKWIQYKPFYWHVKPDRIDPYLSYRLIEPGYEVWNKLQLVERNMESFDERVIADNNLTGGSCMNCHVYGNQDGALSMFHIRGEHGGTIVNRNGKINKINTRGQKMISNAVYGNFHPSGRYAVFSTNIVIPELHTYGSERLEVYDSASDLVVLDFETNRILTQPYLSDSASFETFPAFSPCGKWIYFCTAAYTPLPDSIRSLKYHICRTSFDPLTGLAGTKADTIWNAVIMNGSASFPRISPNGKYLLFTEADYGTFPIWHREADLRLINLETGELDRLRTVNDTCSDSYHSWSSNSRWFVFASKRDDGIYGKPYFAYVDSAGMVRKPFVLPQQDPEYYDNTLKSFNIPELSKRQTSYDARDIEQIYRNMEAKPVF